MWRVVGIALALLLGVAGSSGSGVAATKGTRTKTGAQESKATGSDPAIQQKLDEVLAKQDTILQRLDEMMEELKIIKIRATLR